MSSLHNSPQSSSDVHTQLSEISSTINQPPTPIQVIGSTNTPLIIPRIKSTSNLAALTDNFSLDEQSQLNTKYANHSFSQLLSNSQLHDQVASEIDYSTYIGKQKHLFAHTPGTTYYYSQSLFSITYKKLLSLLTFLFTLHWFNHGIFQNILSNTSSSNYNSTQSPLILSSSLIAIVIFAPIVGYLARRHPPLRILWIGFSIILLATFITSFAGNFYAMLCARFLMGIGDATIIPIAAPIVLYTAPPDKKSLCLSIFLSSITLGYSFGYFVSSELLDTLPNELKIIDESWQRLFCWETIFLFPILGYSWWTIRGPDSFIAMANYNIKTHSLYDIITNQLYLGIVFGHILQGFGCCILTIIVWNKLNNSDFLGNGKGFKLDAYELWSLTIFIFGTAGILIGGLLVDYVHNNSVFSAKKKRPKKNSKIRNENMENVDIHKLSIAETASQEDNGDNANSHSLGNGINNTTKSDNIPIKIPITNTNLTPQGYLSKSLDLSPNTTSQNNMSNNMSNDTNNASAKWSLNSECGYDPNQESIEQYTLRKKLITFNKKLQNSLSHIPPPEMPADNITQRQSLAALKKEQIKRKERRKKRRQKRKRRKKRELKKRFKPTTNLHTIRICFYKVVIPTSLICLLCIILLYFFNNNLWAFGFLGLIAQILTFIQISALYTSMLWSIGIEWQCFGCGLAEIGFHLAGDGVSPGLISNLFLFSNGFQFKLLILIIVMLISILIFFITWKFVDFQIWNITKNSKNSKMFGLMYDESTYTSSITSSITNTNTTITTNTITKNINSDDSEEYNHSHSHSDSDLNQNHYYNNDHYGDDEDSDS
eukprot:436013_1